MHRNKLTEIKIRRVPIATEGIPGYQGSSPDPGCQFPASTSPKIRGKGLK